MQLITENPGKGAMINKISRFFKNVLFFNTIEFNVQMFLSKMHIHVCVFASINTDFCTDYCYMYVPNVAAANILL